MGLSDPVRLKAGGAYIDTEHGHANPLPVDFNGDGVFDFLIGQFEGGKARIYLNKGTNMVPKFEGFTWLQAGGTDAKVPFG